MSKDNQTQFTSKNLFSDPVEDLQTIKNQQKTFNNTHSRRDFIKKCSGLAVWGLCVSLFPALTGCREKESSSKLNNEVSASGAASTAGYIPSYISLHKSGELKKRGETLWKKMESCTLCPRNCRVNRLQGNKGFCQASSQLEIASYNPHFGEEKPLVGRGGSGTVFFSNCALRCVFCINWQISQEGQGHSRTIEDLAQMMLKLQQKGCLNINVVTPTHYSPHILLALDKAAGEGLKLPLVYNTCGWENIEVLKMLDGVADIYLPDFKYSDREMASKLSRGAGDYPEVTQQSLLEMYRQVGKAEPAEDGIVYRGLMIRHLVMPNNAGGTKEVMAWIGENLPKDTFVNLMSQYIPVYEASQYPEISRRITRQEYSEAIKWAKEAGLTNVQIQGHPL